MVAEKASTRGRLPWRWFAWRNLGITLAVLTIGIRVAGFYWGEQLWSAYFPVYKVFRLGQEYAWGWVDFPLVYVWFPGLLVFLGYRLIRRFKRGKPNIKKPLWERFKLRFKQMANLGGAVFVLFHVLWGFNYLHNPLAAMLPDVQGKISSEELCFEAEWAARNAEYYREKALGSKKDSLSIDDLPLDFQERIGQNLISLMDSLSLPHAIPANGKRIYPKGLLKRMGISGVYNPFTGEGNVDAAVAPVLIPDVVGHEMSHGMGYTDEGSCNFLGILACMRDPHPVIRYSGYFSYYLYIAGDLFLADPDLHKMVRHTVDEGMASDLKAYRNAIRRYRGWLSKVGQTVNHAYLSTQGVRGGIDNYGEVVAYMHHLQVSRSFGQQRRQD